MSDIPTPPPDLPPNQFPPPEMNQPPRRFDPDQYTDFSYASDKLNIPSIALMVTALLSGLYCCFNIFSALFTDTSVQVENLRGIYEAMGIPMDENMVDLMSQGASKFVGALIWFFFLAIDLFLFFAATRMRSLRNYGLALAAAVIASIPCCWSACCFINVPFGIWIWVLLRDPAIKNAFIS